MHHRPIIWKLLVGYIPSTCHNVEEYLGKKRSLYFELSSDLQSDCIDEMLLHQIKIDVLRTNQNELRFRDPAVQKSLGRILYTWAARHPASGYVQGMNDVAVPFLSVFFSDQSHMDAEADSYWCFCLLMQGNSMLALLLKSYRTTLSMDKKGFFQRFLGFIQSSRQ